MLDSISPINPHKINHQPNGATAKKCSFRDPEFTLQGGAPQVKFVGEAYEQEL